MIARTDVSPNFTAPAFLTLSDLVRMGYSRSGWYELAKQGKIKFRKLGGKTVVLREDLDRFLRELPEMKSGSS